MKLLTVKEYAQKEGICLAAAYKRIAKGNVKSQNKFGKVLIQVK
jgi:hypothetical protein